MPVACSAKQKWVEHSIKVHEIRNGNDVLRGILLGEAPIRHIKLPLAKSGSPLRDEMGWVRAGFGVVLRSEVLGHSLPLTQVF